MADAPLSVVLRQLRRMLGTASAVDWSDQQLLERFTTLRDRDAFAVLMERHGPLVWSTCCRLLKDIHTAEDAFQATFMILVRKAGAIRRGATLPSWLHRVAFRVALYARTQAGRLRIEPTEVDTMPAPEPNNEAEWKELRPILDEEINCLPEKYRTPIVLCYMQGKTNEEAARLLGWTKGTLSGRLARARDLLRARLTRRGITLSTGAVVAACGELTGTAAVPATLMQSTFDAMSLIAAGQPLATGAVSAAAAALVKGALAEMTASKLRVFVLALLCVTVMGTSTGAAIFWAGAGQAVDKIAEPPKKAAPPLDPSKVDLEKLQGTWGIVVCKLDGSHIAESLTTPAKDPYPFVFEGNMLRLREEQTHVEGRIRHLFANIAYDKPVSLLFSLDAEKKPKTVDFLDGDVVIRGIYRFDGDKLELCVGGPIRPTEFSGRPVSTLLVLKRMAKVSETEPTKTTEGRLLQLAKAKQGIARDLLRLRMLEFSAGRESYQLVHEAARLVRDSEIELAADKEQHLAALQAYFDVLKEAEVMARRLEPAGRLTLRDAYTSTIRRLEAEEALEREKAK